MIRLGFAGTNDLLYGLVPSLRETNSFQITGIYDVKEKPLFEISDKLLIQPVIIPETLFMRSDAIMVVGDPANYYELLIKSLQLSKHLFIADTGSLSSKQIENLIKLAKEGQVVIYTASRLGFLDELRKIKRKIQNPYLIEIFRKKAFSTCNFNHELLRELIKSSIEVLLNINQAGILKIHPGAFAIFSEQIDFMNIRIDFVNGCIANISSGLISGEDEFQIKIYFKGGIFNIDILKEEIRHVMFDENRKVKKGIFYSEKDDLKILEQHLNKFQELILQQESSTISLEESYNTIALTSRIFEKAQISVFQERND